MFFFMAWMLLLLVRFHPKSMGFVLDAPAIERAFASGKPAVVQVGVDDHTNNSQMPNWSEFCLWCCDDAAYS
jgi:hypothetical protein